MTKFNISLSFNPAVGVRVHDLAELAARLQKKNATAVHVELFENCLAPLDANYQRVELAVGDDPDRIDRLIVSWDDGT